MKKEYANMQQFLLKHSPEKVKQALYGLYRNVRDIKESMFITSRPTNHTVIPPGPKTNKIDTFFISK